ncbi:MAG TPA: chorismate mutase [Stellaceae bacterium]|nr:chorismate mutase [Stellaceae bacterium]
MADPHWTLDELRRKIDEIDDELHDLLMRRTEIVGEIGALKKNDRLPALRPGREAMILRRLMARHQGPLPRPLIVRIWRELLSGTIALQVDFAVAVYAPDSAPGYWDIARDHYGSHTPMTAYSTAVQVLRAVTEGEASVGVLPIPQDGEAEPWWPHLSATDPATPKVIARLPFAGHGNARSGDAEALAIGRGDLEATGADRSLLVIDTSREMSRGKLLSALKAGGFEPAFLAAVERVPDFAADLLELEGIVRADDKRLKDALRPLGEATGAISFLGGYARPLTPQEIASPRRGATRRRGQVP